MIIRYCITCIPGLEFISQEEIRTRFCVTTSKTVANRVYFDYDGDVYKIALLRSNENLFVAIEEFEFSDLSHIEREAGKFDLYPFFQTFDTLHGAGLGGHAIPLDMSFRIRCKRTGEHDFNSMDVERTVGGAIRKKYPNLKVNLKDFRYEIRVLIKHNRCEVLGQLSLKRSAKRSYRVYYHPATLNPPIAFGLMMLSKPAEDDIFLDPMCGSGTILLERASWRQYRKIIGGDLKQKYLLGAKQNIDASGQKDISLTRWDVRCGIALKSDSVTHIATNLPFGRRVGNREANEGLYQALLMECFRVLKNGRIAVMYTNDRSSMSTVLKNTAFKVETSFPVVQGILHPFVYVLRK